MHKRNVFCGQLFSCQARALPPLSGFLGLLLTGLFANMGLGQELDWARQAGGIGRDDGRDIAVDGAGNSYVIGNFSDTATFGPQESNQTILTSAEDPDVFVAKYDNLGALIWAKQAGGTGWENGSGIAVDGAGNSYVTGYFDGTAIFGTGEVNETVLTGKGSIFVAKYDSAGAVVWAKQAGGSGMHYEAHIAVDEAGNSYVTGALFGMGTFGRGEANEIVLTASAFDVFVAKFDSAGALMWAKRAGGRDDDYGYGIGVDGVGNSYVTGFFGYSDYFRGGGAATFGPGEANQTILPSNGGGVTFFAAKYDSAGALVWAKRAGETGWSEGLGIAVDGAGNSCVTGVFEGVAIFDPGETNQTILTSAGDNEAFIAKYDSAGALVWAKRATALAGGSIAVDASGNTYVTGGFTAAATFAPGEANQTTLTGAREDGFLAKYDSAGKLVWVKRAGGNIAVDRAGNSYVTGSFGGTAAFGTVEANPTILTSAGDRDAFVAKYGRGLYEECSASSRNWTSSNAPVW